MQRAAHALFAVFFSLFLLLSTALPTFAQSPANLETNTNPDVPKNMHTYTQSVVIELLATTICQLAGIDPINPDQPCLGIDPQTKKIGFVKDGGGAIGATTQMISMMYTPPIHTGDYLNYMASNFGIAKRTYAADNCQNDRNGNGFCSILPLHGIWLSFEKIAFFVIILIFILIGLMIMLRIKIDPRTVMSIENQLPKIIISLVLITMSFAISGVLIDFMWTSMYVVTNLLAAPEMVASPGMAPTDAKQESDTVIRAVNQQIYTPPAGVVNNMFRANQNFFIGGGIPTISYNAGAGTKNILESLFTSADANKFWQLQDAEKCGSVFNISCYWAAGPSNFIGGLVIQVMGTFIAWFLGIAAIAIVFFALLVALFRLWFALILAYAYILLDIVLAPFWILLGLIPGSPVGIEAWFRDFLANLSVFPTTLAMFLLGKIFMAQFAASNNELFVPPFIANPQATDSIGAIVGVAIILMTPVVVTMMRELLKAPNFKYTAEIGRSLSGPAGAPGRAMKGVGQYTFGFHYNKTGGGEYGHGPLGQGAVGTFVRSMGWFH